MNINMNSNNRETETNNKKCSHKGCGALYIINNSIFSPHYCELCNNYFCFNCMYLTCSICHKSYACFHCGFNYKENHKANGNAEYITKCMKHVDTIGVKCEEIDCMCKETI